MVKNLPTNVEDARDKRFNSWVRKIPWRREWLPTPLFLLGKSMERGIWWTIVHGVTWSQTQLSTHTLRVPGMCQTDLILLGRMKFMVKEGTSNLKHLFFLRCLKRSNHTFKVKTWRISTTTPCCSVAKSCLTLCDPMDRSTPGFPVLHYLLEFAQTHVH